MIAQDLCWMNRKRIFWHLMKTQLLWYCVQTRLKNVVCDIASLPNWNIYNAVFLSDVHLIRTMSSFPNSLLCIAHRVLYNSTHCVLCDVQCLL